MSRNKLSAAIIAGLMVSPLYAGTVTSDGADLILKTKGGLSLKTADNDYSVRLGGRLMWDYNYTELNGDDTGEDNFDVRRARIFVSGTAKDWAYKLQFNIGDNPVDNNGNDQPGTGGTAEDLYIRYKGFGKKAVVTVGKQQEPFGLELLTSSKYISMLERSAITEAYASGRLEGVVLNGADGAFTYALGVFEDDGFNQDDDLVITGRTTYAPIKNDDTIVHLGLAASKRPDSTDVFGLEAAAVLGAFHIQSEYMESSDDTADNDGFYVQAGWVITGESRPYKKGVFKQIKPKGKAGAWEVVARYEDGDGNHSDIELGRTDASAYGIGVNWYASNLTRLSLNYTAGDSNVNDDDGSEVRFRAQIAF